MNTENFSELVASIQEAGNIKAGTDRPARKTSIAALDIKAIRKRMDVSQVEFAHLIGVSENTFRNWEQGRRHPEGPR